MMAEWTPEGQVNQTSKSFDRSYKKDVDSGWCSNEGVSFGMISICGMEWINLSCP